MAHIKVLKTNYEDSKKRDSDTTVAIIDGAKAGTMNEFYNQVQRGLKLPSYFGKNLDGLFDCLCDFSWLDADEIHIVLRNYDDFLVKEAKNERWNLLAVLNDAAAEWKGMKGKDKIKFEVYVEPSQRIKQDLDDAEI